MSSGQTRVITVPDKNITLDDAGDSRTPTAHAASHAAGQADELFDQSLNEADAVEFASVGVDGTPVGIRKFHQFGGKFTVESDSGGFGQFQVVNPEEGEVSFVFAAGSTCEENGSLTTTNLNNEWAFGAGTFGNSPDIFTIGNGGAATSVFHIKAPSGYVGIGPTNSDPAEALDVDGNIAMRDLENDVAATFDAQGALSADRTYTLPDADGTLVLDSQLGTAAVANLGTGATDAAYGNHTHTFGTTAGTFTEGNDARLSDSRTPTAHAASHAAGGSDPLDPSDIGLGATDDVTFASVSAESLKDSSGAVIINAESRVIYDGSGINASDIVFGFGNGVLETALPISFSNDNNQASANAATTRTNLGVAIGTDVAAASHTHGNLTNDGKLGSTAGLPVVTTTAGAVSTLALGTANQVLRVNSGASGVEFADPAASGVTTGSVDNAVLRADGVSGSQSQSSAIVIDDAVVPFSITGDASTDIITAVGHNFTNNQGVRFPTLTGGNGLTAATTNYFVRDISGDTFKVSTTSGGAAVNFTTNITAGTVIAMQANVAIVNNSSETESALVLTPKGATAAFILGAKPDGTAAGGNPRGANAVDLQTSRNAATQVASAGTSSVLGGQNNTASGAQAVVGGGFGNTASGQQSIVFGGRNNTASNDRAVAAGDACTASAPQAVSLGWANSSSATSACALGETTIASAAGAMAICIDGVANRRAMLAQAAGRFAAQGDAQRIHAVLRNKTTNATATELFLDGSSARLTIPSGKVMAGIMNCVGVKSDGSAVAHYVRQFCCKNVAGTSSLVGTVTTIGTDQEDNASTDISVTISDANDAVTISVTGIASETWRWVASVDAVEVAYGS